MRAATFLALLVASATAACVALVLIPQLGSAGEVKPANPAPCTCPNPDASPALSPKPKFAEAKTELDENDEIAALEAIRVALTEVGDGGSYVWHRQHGRLSGVVHPTVSFKDPIGRVCRH